MTVNLSNIIGRYKLRILILFKLFLRIMAFIAGSFMMNILIFRVETWLVNRIFILGCHDKTIMYYIIVIIFITRLIFILNITIHLL